MNNNNCDGAGPHKPGQVRVLPAGGAGNLILCRSCFNAEIKYRRDENRERKRRVMGPPLDLPKWQECKIYGEEPKSELSPIDELLSAMERTIDAVKTEVEKLPPLPFPLPECCAERELRVIEQGYERCTTVAENEQDNAPCAFTDGWDDYSEEGRFEWVECLSCGKRWKTPEGLDYV